LFTGDNDIAIMRKLIACEIAPPSSRRPEVPAALDTIVLRALSREPDDRFADMRAFEMALTRFMFSGAIDAENVHLRDVVQRLVDVSAPQRRTQVMPGPEGVDALAGLSLPVTPAPVPAAPVTSSPTPAPPPSSPSLHLAKTVLADPRAGSTTDPIGGDDVAAHATGHSSAVSAVFATSGPLPAAAPASSLSSSGLFVDVSLEAEPRTLPDVRENPEVRAAMAQQLPSPVLANAHTVPSVSSSPRVATAAPAPALTSSASASSPSSRGPFGEPLPSALQPPTMELPRVPTHVGAPTVELTPAILNDHTPATRTLVPSIKAAPAPAAREHVAVMSSLSAKSTTSPASPDLTPAERASTRSALRTPVLAGGVVIAACVAVFAMQALREPQAAALTPPATSVTTSPPLTESARPVLAPVAPPPAAARPVVPAEVPAPTPTPTVTTSSATAPGVKPAATSPRPAPVPPVDRKAAIAEALRVVEPTPKPEAPVEVTKAPEAKAVEPVKTGTVYITIINGWAEVFDGATALGETPTTVELTAGRHRLLLRQPEQHKQKTVEIVVPANGKLQVNERFE
jgi:serine/threonine-protein kinase